MRVEVFEWDDANLEHVGERGFAQFELDSVLDGAFFTLRNKRRRPGQYRVVGRTTGGRLVTIVVAPHPLAGVWRPVTALDADAEERAYARKAGI